MQATFKCLELLIVSELALSGFLSDGFWALTWVTVKISKRGKEVVHGEGGCPRASSSQVPSLVSLLREGLVGNLQLRKAGELATFGRKVSRRELWPIGWCLPWPSSSVSTPFLLSASSLDSPFPSAATRPWKCSLPWWLQVYNPTTPPVRSHQGASLNLSLSPI